MDGKIQKKHGMSSEIENYAEKAETRRVNV